MLCLSPSPGANTGFELAPYGQPPARSEKEVLSQRESCSPLMKTIVSPPRPAQVTGNDFTESSDKSNSSVREESNPWHEGELASNYAPYGHLMRSALVRLLATPHKLQRSIMPESDDANADNMPIMCSQRPSCHHMPLSRMQLSLITYHFSCLDTSSLVTVKWQRAIAELRRLSWRAWG